MAMFIPRRIKVGFQNRTDTYTKQLAYVIYYDNNGTLRKEQSWESWRNKNIEPKEFDNSPMEGFVLNKKVGGYKSDWNFRNAYVRVYDPRGFEFEISVDNLLFILSCGGCSPGKGLEGKFVYSWSGTELVLLPVNSDSYSEIERISGLSGKKINLRELVPGMRYYLKDGSSGTYVGRYRINIVAWNLLNPNEKYFLGEATKKEKQVVFFIDGKYSIVDKKKISEAFTADEYFNEIRRDFESVHDLKVVKLFSRASDPRAVVKGIATAELGDSLCISRWGNYFDSELRINNGLLEIIPIQTTYTSWYSFPNYRNVYEYKYTDNKYKDLVTKPDQEIVAELSDGQIYVFKG